MPKLIWVCVMCLFMGEGVFFYVCGCVYIYEVLGMCVCVWMHVRVNIWMHL